MRGSFSVAWRRDTVKRFLARLPKLITDLVSFVQFARAPGLFTESDLDVPDAYGEEGRERTRVFISYERRSYALAEKLRNALRTQNLAAFIYTPVPTSDLRVVDKTAYTKLEQLEHFQSTSPYSARELEATLRRTNWFIFLVSEHSVGSGACDVETFASFFSGARVQGKSPTIVVKEKAHLDLPDLLRRFPTYVYKPGLENLLARQIACIVQSVPVKVAR